MGDADGSEAIGLDQRVEGGELTLITPDEATGNGGVAIAMVGHQDSFWGDLAKLEAEISLEGGDLIMSNLVV